jgi:Na+-translocating ferredoxin:NAD+ oxidoreductase RnfE subunit
MQQGACPTSDLGLHHGKIQKVGIIIRGIIMLCLTSGRATNAWVVGASANDVSTLSTLDGVVQTMGNAIDAHSLGVVRTS